MRFAIVTVHTSEATPARDVGGTSAIVKGCVVLLVKENNKVYGCGRRC